MAKLKGLVAIEQRKSVFFIMVNKIRFGMGPKTRLSIDREFDPEANVNVLCSNLVKLYRAIAPPLRVSL
jgi:hypothetical protein